MSTKRRSYESGHKPKCLVIIDDTAECDRAVYYAARWAKRSGGGVVMLRVIEADQRNQEWRGVADIMRAEAHEEANTALDRRLRPRQRSRRHHPRTGDPRRRSRPANYRGDRRRRGHLDAGASRLGRRGGSRSDRDFGRQDRRRVSRSRSWSCRGPCPTKISTACPEKQSRASVTGLKSALVGVLSTFIC